MRYGALRDPSFRSSDLEHVGVSHDMYATPFQESQQNLDTEMNENTIARQNSTRYKIYGVLVFFIIVGLVVTVGVIDRDKTLKYFKPLYSIEDAKGLAFLYHLESKKAEAAYSAISEEETKLLFKGFIAKFAKEYTDEVTKSESFDIFKKTLQIIDRNNEANLKAGGEIVHGLNKYADMSAEAFKKKFLTARRPDNTNLITRKASTEPYTGDEANVDWSGKYTTPVTDQGLCGACWAFSAINQIESDSIRTNLLKVTDHLSAEQLISCADDSVGCQGGWTEIGFEYVKENGVALFSTYPYADFWQPDHASSCYADRASSMITLTDVFSVGGEDAMVDHVKGVGPLSVCIDADEWQTYSGGILTSCGMRADHCVQVVGVNTNEGYWKIRNNWGPDWGEDGYIRIALGENLCAIETDPHYTAPALVKHDTLSIKNIFATLVQSSYVIDAADLYIVYVLGSQTHTTNVLQDSKNPQWLDEFQINWDGISDLKVYMYDSNWFLPDSLLGSLQINLLSADFPAHDYIPIDQPFDNSNSKIRFELRMDMLPEGVQSVAKNKDVKDFDSERIQKSFPASGSGAREKISNSSGKKMKSNHNRNSKKD